MRCRIICLVTCDTLFSLIVLLHSLLILVWFTRSTCLSIRLFKVVLLVLSVGLFISDLVFTSKASNHIYLLAQFFFLSWGRLAVRSVQSYEEWSFFSVSSRLGPLLDVFRQVRDKLILESHEMMRVSHVVACPIVFILFYVWDWLRAVFKIVENNLFLVFLAGWVLFPMFLQKWRTGLY